MFEILEKQALNPTVTRMTVAAPAVAGKARAGQFVILRPTPDSERIPLTVADWDAQRGTVTVIFQVVGATTLLLNSLQPGQCLADFAGPLGNATDLSAYSRVAVIGGGVGCAIALPVAKALSAAGKTVDAVLGFRNKDLVILENEFRSAADSCTLMTDDGTAGRCGNVCIPLEEMLQKNPPDAIFAVGPLIMMKFVVAAARPYKIPCMVSMNPIMIDGTGMCGGCRLSVVENGQRRMAFACVEGPDFDGYTVDFDEAMQRNAAYREFEHHAYARTCNLLKKGEKGNES